MSDIKLLDQETINQIAAGEVIDRPASVVKELLENAIDAGSTGITVEIKEGGTSLIRITDNGSGIEKKDIPLAFLRHSTSKIKDVTDLLTISSLGFRGEALSSIAAVSQVELITKSKESDFGCRYVINGGTEESIEEIGVPDGTTFLVRNLFYNTPARKKFLKTPATEAGYINEIVEKIALSHPDISIKFINNGSNRLYTSSGAKLKEVIYSIYGRDITSNLIEINRTTENVSICGYIAKPVVTRGNRNFENYFINGRYIKNNIISKAIEDAYKSFIMQHKYPFTVFHIDIDNKFLDVNVHPSKMEIRFENQTELYDLIVETIHNALTEKEIIPDVVLEKNEIPKKEKIVAPEPFEKQRLNSAKEKETVVSENNTYKTETLKYTEKNNCSEITKPIENNYSEKKTGESLTDIKEVNSTNNPVNITGNNAEKKDEKEISEIPEKNIIKQENSETDISEIDRDKPDIQKRDIHKTEISYTSDIMELNKSAADTERFKQDITEKNDIVKNTEQLTLFDDKFLSKKAKEQHKLIGQVFDTYWIVQYGNTMYIMDQHAAHEKVLYERMMKNFETKEFDSQQISPPIILTLSLNEENILNNNLSDFNKLGYEIEHFGGSDYSVRAVPYYLFSLNSKDLLLEIIDEIGAGVRISKTISVIEKIASASCKAAVKGNMKLSTQEVDELVTELLELENPYNCPHGRPTLISFSKAELEKKFKRIL